MIIKTDTGEYDDSIPYQAIDLAQNSWWIEQGYRVTMLNGRTAYNKAFLGKKKGVYLVREIKPWGTRVYRTVRNVRQNTLLRLVKREVY